jgi:hypothetical protein
VVGRYVFPVSGKLNATVEAHHTAIRYRYCERICEVLLLGKDWDSRPIVQLKIHSLNHHGDGPPDRAHQTCSLSSAATFFFLWCGPQR